MVLDDCLAFAAACSDDVRQHVDEVVQALSTATWASDPTATTLRHLLTRSGLQLNEETAGSLATIENPEGTTLANEAKEIAWERLHSGQWDQVQDEFREAYGAAQIVLAHHALRRGAVRCALKDLDLTLLMGGPLNYKLAVRLAQMTAALMGPPLPTQGEPGSLKRRNQAGLSQAPKRPRLSSSSTSNEASAASSQSGSSLQRISIQRCAAPSLENFYEEYLKTGLPVILTGAINHWPAMGCPPCRAWDDGSGRFAAVRRAAGHRTVPVEIGNKYTDDDWSQELMPLSTFLDSFITGDSSESHRGTGYLAQHELFRQCPELRRDVSLPDYCALLLPEEEAEASESPVLNAWLGPEGTVSPAHYDPKHNLLAQVVGTKRVLLFSPADSHCLYPNSGMMNNTSSVDCDEPDLKAFPRFAEGVGFEGELAPGELLYIPPLWWHHIRSLKPSFSVSFWWGKHWTYDNPPNPAKRA